MCRQVIGVALVGLTAACGHAFDSSPYPITLVATQVNGQPLPAVIVQDNLHTLTLLSQRAVLSADARYETESVVENQPVGRAMSVDTLLEVGTYFETPDSVTLRPATGTTRTLVRLTGGEWKLVSEMENVYVYRRSDTSR